MKTKFFTLILLLSLTSCYPPRIVYEIENIANNEKDSLEFEVDLDDLDMTNILTRYQAYEVAVRNGWMQLDEVRYEEGRNPLGLDFIRLGLDTVIYDPVKKEIYTPNTKEWVKLDQPIQNEGGDGDESGNQSG